MAPIPGTGNAIDVYRLPDYDLIGTPTTAHDVMYRPEKNGCGTGSFTVAMADDAAYGDIQINDVAAIRRDGATVAALVIEQIVERTLDENGAARQTCTYSGRLVGCFLEWAVIAPALGDQAKPVEEDAVFDWRSPRYDPANDPWENATEIMTVTAAKAGGWPTTPMGQDFTDSTGAFMIWHSSGDDTDAPVGTCLFYEDIVITDPGRYVLETFVDNEGPVYVDGIEVLDISQTEGYHRASFKAMTLTADTHRFCWAVNNINGPAAMAYNLFKADHQNHQLAGTFVISKSTSATQVLEYPDPFPGMWVTEILRRLVVEARDGAVDAFRDCFPWLDCSFEDDEDSNTDPVDRISVTTKTGTTYLQFLDELVAAGHIARWRVRPNGSTFDVFAPGYSTRPGDVELEPATGLDPATGELLELNRKIT